jgi:hypothetical protein
MGAMLAVRLGDAQDGSVATYALHCLMFNTTRLKTGSPIQSCNATQTCAATENVNCCNSNLECVCKSAYTDECKAAYPNEAPSAI